MTSPAQANIAIVGYGAIGRYTVGALRQTMRNLPGWRCRSSARRVIAETQAALGPAIQV